MPTLQVLEVDEQESRVLVLWDSVLGINHHKSDSEDYIEKLKREYPEKEAVAYKALCDAGIREPFPVEPFPDALPVVTFEVQDVAVPVYEAFVQEVTL